MSDTGSIALALAAVLDARRRVGSEDEGTVAAMGGLANALSERGREALKRKGSRDIDEGRSHYDARTAVQLRVESRAEG